MVFFSFILMFASLCVEGAKRKPRELLFVFFFWDFISFCLCEYFVVKYTKTFSARKRRQKTTWFLYDIGSKTTGSKYAEERDDTDIQTHQALQSELADLRYRYILYTQKREPRKNVHHAHTDSKSRALPADTHTTITASHNMSQTAEPNFWYCLLW